jgi:hypothetical protein
MLNYQEFLYETYGKPKLNKAKENFLKTLASNQLNESEQYVFNFLIAEGLALDIFQLFEENDYEALHESFVEKAKEKYEKAKELIKTKGRAAMNTISVATKNLIKIGGDILKPIKMILQKVAEVLKKAWDSAKELGEKHVEKHKDAIIQKFKGMVEEGDEDISIKDETKHVGGMIAAGTKFITGGFTENLGKAAKTAATTEENEFTFIGFIEAGILNEISSDINSGISIEEIIGYLNESDDHGDGHEDKGGLKIPYISKIMDKIAHIPPFSYFHKMGDAVKGFTNNSLSKASVYIHKICDGPSPYKFIAFGALVGVVVGYYTEDWAKHEVLHMLARFAIPGLGILETIIGTLGVALAVYGIVKVMVGEEDTDEEDKGKE